MIYLRNERLLFIKPFKVAGTSFEICLSTFAGPHDIVTTIAARDEEMRRDVGGVGPQNYRRPGKRPKPRHVLQFLRTGHWPPSVSQHMTAAELGKRIRQTYDGATKISIVRNPFDVLASWYYWRHKTKSDLPDFGSWLRDNPHFIALNAPFYYVDGRMQIDRFIRYEHMQEDCKVLEGEWPTLAGLSDLMGRVRTKIDTRPPGSKAAGLFEPFPDLIDAVRRENAEIIERFGYGLV